MKKVIILIGVITLFFLYQMNLESEIVSEVTPILKRTGGECDPCLIETQKTLTKNVLLLPFDIEVLADNWTDDFARYSLEKDSLEFCSYNSRKTEVRKKFDLGLGNYLHGFEVNKCKWVSMIDYKNELKHTNDISGEIRVVKKGSKQKYFNEVTRSSMVISSLDFTWDL